MSNEELKENPIEEPEVPDTPEGGNEVSSENSDVSEKSNNMSQKISKGIQHALKKGGAAKHSLIAAIGPILFWIFVILVILIIAIGLIMFFVTMPGMVMEKIKALAEEIGDSWASWWGQNSAEQVEDEQIYSVLDYLEQMGYDLKGHGFLTDYVGDDNTGVEKDENDMISNAKSDFIYYYLVSENYLYTIKNFNTDTDGNGWAAFWDHVSALVADSLSKRTGMLAFYHEGGGEIGSTSENAYDAWERGSIKVDVKSKTLEIKKGWTNNPMTFKLDGWTGRYGMPIDFLISVQLATLMPDLAYDMYDNFQTEIKILLHETKGDVEGTYKTDSGGFVNYEAVAEAINGFAGKNIFTKIWNGADEWGLNAGEAQAMIELGIIPDGHNPPECGCEISETYTYDGCPVYKDGETYFYYKYNDDLTVEKVTLEQSDLSEENKTTTLIKVGDSCKKFLKNVVKYMKKANDYDYATYVPYIENVTDHWYRDVYFITNSSVNEFVDYDYEYEAMMKERWTLYETYEDENSENFGEYKLYAINKDGGYATSESQIENYAENSSKFEKSGSYYLFKGSQNDANEAKIKVAKKAVTVGMDKVYEDLGWTQMANGQYSAYSSDENTTPDYQQVYKSGDAGATEEYEKADDETKKVLDRIYSVVNIGNIVQTGEGQRTVTNEKIKKMFLQNRYFRYDGSEETAEIITKLRKDNNIPYGPLSDESLKAEVTIQNEDGENKTYTVKDYSGNVTLNQDSLNAFSMLENTHTLDADYIYRDFKELIVELGYFTKEELTEETPRLLQWLVPDIGSGGYPNRVIDKREQEYGTMIHSKGDIDANIKNTLAAAIAMAADEESTEELEAGGAANTDETNGISVRAKEFDEAVKGLNLKNQTEFTSLGAAANPSSSSELLSIDEWWESQQEMFDVFKAESWTYALDHSCATFEDARASKHTTDCSLMASWALQRVGALKDGHTFSSHMGHSGTLDESNACAQDLLDAGAEVIVPPAGTKFSSAATSGELAPGDVLFYDGHVSIYCGEDYEKGGTTFCWDTGSTKGIQCGGPRDTSYENRDIKLIIRLPLGTAKAPGNPYKGYEGNEAVVSPVTGILLDYGTYTDEDINSVTGEKYRTNVDLKYGPAYTPSEKDEEENVQTNTDKNIDTETEGGEIVSDQVGYAKILVLDAENYQKLESKTNNKWQDSKNSLVEIGEAKTSINSEAALETEKSSARYLEKLGSEEEITDDWTNMDKTVYGYKEFAEMYEKYGIAGNVIYIDGFKCEMPDTELTGGEDSETSDSKISEQIPNGKELSLESFQKITEGDLTGTEPLESEDVIESKYVQEDEYKLASKKATNKLNAESLIKNEANSSVYLEKEDLIFIKEGTVIGRTITDKELVTEIRKDKPHSYEYYRPDGGSNSNTENSTDEENQDKVMGNYLRIIMRDLDDTVVENVEDYMKIDEGEEVMEELEDEKFLYWMGIYLEGGNLEQQGDKWISVPVDLSDGAGATHYFGLTHYNLDLAKKLGYNISNWGDNQDLEMLTDVYLALIEEQKAQIRQELGEDIEDGYLQAFISILHNYGNLTKRGDEYKATGKVSESTWTTYEGTQYAEALTKRRIGEWKIITEGKYMNCYEGNTQEIDFTEGGKYSEETPFTDWCKDHGITNIEIKKPEE